MSKIEVCRWLDFKGDRAQAIPDLDHIFFSSSARQSFANETERVEFRERWLGRYLSHFAGHAFVAIDADRRDAGQRIVGYVIGSLEDPARDPLFADLPFWGSFAHLTVRYPAQLHVNVDADKRGQNIGAALVAAFADHAARQGAPGVHAITGRGLRNVGFYLANGFAELGVFSSGGRDLLFLGRPLSPRDLR